MSQPASAAPSRKKTVISLLVLAALTSIIVLLFKDNWAEITAALSQLSAWQVLVVLAIGLSYPLLEGCVAWVIVRSRIPGFRLWQGIDTAWCGTFGNVVTLGAGAVPVQTWYLHRCGLPVGPGVGLMTLQYVFHKTTVLLYATVMLLFQHRWLAANTTGVMNYLPMAYAVVAATIVVLVLVCGVGTLACIYLCNVLNRPSACAISAIVCCSIMLSHSGQERYFYTVARMLETAVGILVAMAVNHVLPGKPEASKADP